MSEPTTTDSAIEQVDNSGGFIDSLDSYFEGVGDTPQPEADDPVGDDPVSDDLVEQEEPVDSTEDPLGLDEADPKDWTPQAARRFKELKSELKTYRTRAQELEVTAHQRETRLKELEAVANNPEFETLQQRVEQYEQQMLVNKLEQSRTYKELVEKPLSQLVGESDTLAAKYNIEPSALLDLIAESDEAVQEERLTELLVHASDRDKFRVYKMIEEVQPILEQRRTLQENAQEAIREVEELEQARSQYELSQRATQRLEAASAVAERLQNKLTFLSGIEGVDMHTLAQEAASVDPSTLDPVTGTYQAMAAKLLPKMANEYYALRRELEALTDQLAEYDKASPRTGGGSGNYASTSPAGSDKSFLDAVSAAFGG